MNYHSDVIQLISDRANVTEGIYFKDGIKMCSLCDTPLQRYVSIGNTDMIVNCMCQCRVAKALAEEQAIKDELKRQEIARNREVGIKAKKYKDWTFDVSEIPLNTELRYVKKFDKMLESNSGLMFVGGRGTGKTFRASCIANALIDRGYRVYINSVTAMCNDIEKAYDRQSYVDDICGYDLLVIDDIGAERKTEYMQEMLYNVINTRYNVCKPLIITSNISLETMKNCGDGNLGRIYDRIFEMCCYPITLTGESRRRSAGNGKYKIMKELLSD